MPFKAIFFTALLAVVVDGAAQDAGSDIAGSQDCAEIRLPETGNGLLTQEEKIALLERALLRSLSNFEPCSSSDSDTVSGASAGGNASEGLQGAESAADTASDAPLTSVAAGDIQGDLPPSELESGLESELESGAPLELPPAPEVETDTIAADAQDNSKLPEDIPSTENDDVIAQQFRQAAIDETDAVKKAALWNEYRRYKGLPEQNGVPE